MSRAAALLGARIREAIGPLAQHCLDEALDFPVRPRGVGSGAFVLDAGIAAQLAELAAAEGRPVVGHDPLDVDLEPAEPPHRAIGPS